MSLSSRTRSWLYPAALLVLCAALFFWRLGVTPLDDFDEAYYAEGAREMLDRGDLGTPYYNGQPFLLKPVLIFWLIAAAFRLFGITEFAARSVSAFFATTIVVLTYWFTARTLGRRAGLLAGLALALCYLWIDIGREAMIDMPLTAALAAAVFLFHLAGKAPARRKRWLYLAFYPLIGIALLAKGPAATGIVLAGLLAYLLAARRLRETLREAHVLPGFVLLLAVAAPWYVYESLRQPAFVATFLIREHFGHLQGELAREEPWYGHLKNLAIGFYPWALLLPAAAAHAFRQDREHVLRLAAWWAGAVIFGFSLGGAKLPHYLVPAFPPMAILVAAWFDAWLGEFVGQELRLLPRDRPALVGLLALSAAGLALGAAFAVAIIMPPALKSRLAQQFGSWTPGPAPTFMLGALAAGSVGAAVAAFARRRRAVFPLLAGAMLVAGFAHVGWFKPRLAQIQAQPRKELAAFASRAVPPSEPLGVFYAKRNATIFYARRPIVDLGEWEQQKLVAFLASPTPATALTHSRLVPDLEAALPRFYLWTQRGDFVLVSNHPLDLYFR
jgi:4-amino-4-deoxy-L-arabinose transferase-like glycosyltransferase